MISKLLGYAVKQGWVDVRTEEFQQAMVDVAETYPPTIVNAFKVWRLKEHYNIFEEVLNNAATKPENFNDMSWLFALGQQNAGITRLAYDEAYFLYKTVNSIDNPDVLEVGRFLGGSTYLLASAVENGSVTSLDNHAQYPSWIDPKTADYNLKRVLRAHNFDNVELLIEDSTKYETDKEFDVIWLDGDHTYHGVKKDLANLTPKLKKNGLLVMHDATQTRPHAHPSIGVMRAANELQSSAFSSEWEYVSSKGTILCVRKR